MLPGFGMSTESVGASARETSTLGASTRGVSAWLGDVDPAEAAEVGQPQAGQVL